jgi:hypothetical protein
MKHILSTLVVGLVLAATGRADRLTLLDGTVHEVELVSIENSKAVMKFERRLETVPLANIRSLQIVRPAPAVVRDDLGPLPRPGRDSATNTVLVLTTKEYLANPDQYRGQRVTVRGLVTQAVKGMAATGDSYILDGVLRCQFRRGAGCTEGDQRETNRTVSLTGTSTGKRRVTSQPDLLECDCPGQF